MSNEVGKKFFHHQILLQHTSLSFPVFCLLTSKYIGAGWAMGTFGAGLSQRQINTIAKLSGGQFPSVFILLKAEPQNIFESLTESGKNCQQKLHLSSTQTA